jgi:aminopeptidase N
VHAARCRAARPDAAAKGEAWELLIHDTTLSNYELYAVAEGFWQAGQDDLTDQYVPRYFADIAATAQLRSGWVVSRIAEKAFPWSAVVPETLQLAEEFITRDNVSSGVRRAVVDAADDLRRALAVRARFPG